MMGQGDRLRRALTRGARLALGCAALGVVACSGSVETIPGADGEVDGTGGQAEPATGGTGGGGMDGTGGGIPDEPDEPYVEPDCPDEPPPPVEAECDPLDPYVGCGEGYGCYPYLDYPYGEGCGHPSFGAICVVASTGEQSDFCGDDLGYCSPGYMCVVGAAGGKRCGKICAPGRDHGCTNGLICGETDIQGFGVCF